MGNSKIGEDDGREFRNLDEATPQGGCIDNAIDGSSENLGDTSISRSDGRPDGSGGRFRQSEKVGIDAAGCGGQSNGMWQTQPSVGGTSDGIAGGMDYAELCVACDNRTDELRLLGNGVVPATAEKAFRTLMEKLL